MNRPWRTVLATWLLIAVAPLTARLARADALSKKMDDLATRLASTLRERGSTSIAIGGMTAPAGLRASADAAILQALTESLKQQGITEDDRAPLEIRGLYNIRQDPPQLSIKLDLIDNNSGQEEKGIAEVGLFDAATVARLLGTTGSLNKPTNRENLSTVLKDAQKPSVALEDAPSASVGDSKVVAPGQPYAVEILAKRGAKTNPVSASTRDGQAVVSLQRTDVYAVRLYNDSPLDAAVELSIDGVNVCALHSDPALRATKFIIRAGKSVLIRGFPDTDGESREFLVAGSDATVDGRLLPKGNPKLGTITAQFAAAWDPATAPPQDEPPPQTLDLGSEDRTVPGERFQNQLRRVGVAVGRPRAQVSVRYSKLNR